MLYNHKQLDKVSDKKVLKKVKKQWIIVSLATFMLVGGASVGLTTDNVKADDNAASVSAGEQPKKEAATNDVQANQVVDNNQVNLHDNNLQTKISGATNSDNQGQAASGTEANNSQNDINLHSNQYIVNGYVATGVTKTSSTETVTPDNPGTPGQKINQSDSNSPVYPQGTDKASLEKTVKRTITYVDSNGQEMAAPHQDEATFKRNASFDVNKGQINYQQVGQLIPFDKDGKQIEGGKYNVSYPNDPNDATKVINPQIPNIPNVTSSWLDPNLTPMDNQGNVLNPGASYPIDANGPAKDLPIFYASRSRIDIQYVDQSGVMLKDDYLIYGLPNQITEQPDLPLISGYHVIACNNLFRNLRFGCNDRFITVTYAKNIDGVDVQPNNVNITDATESALQMPTLKQTNGAKKTFTKNVELGTSNLQYTDWQSDKNQFGAVTSPIFTGYTDDNTTVAAQTITSNTGDINTVVTYTKNITSPVTDRKTVKENITYKYADGSKADETKTVAKEFTRSGIKDDVTGKVTWQAWTPTDQTFAEVDTPTVSGYTPDKTTVAEQTVTVDSDDLNEMVTYTANAKPTPLHPVVIDKDTHQPIKEVNVPEIKVSDNYKTGDKVEVLTKNLPKVSGYDKPAGEKVTVTIGQKGKVAIPYTAKETNTTNHSSNNGKQKQVLPQTGESNSNSVLSLIGISLVSMFGLLGLGKRRRNEK